MIDGEQKLKELNDLQVKSSLKDIKIESGYEAIYAVSNFQGQIIHLPQRGMSKLLFDPIFYAKAPEVVNKYLVLILLNKGFEMADGLLKNYVYGGYEARVEIDNENCYLSIDNLTRLDSSNGKPKYNYSYGKHFKLQLELSIQDGYSNFDAGILPCELDLLDEETGEVQLIDDLQFKDISKSRLKDLLVLAELA